MTSHTLSEISEQPPRLGRDHINQHLSSAPVTKLYLILAFPIAIGLILNGLYSLVDAYFIARFVGANGFASVSAVFPFQLVVIAVAMLIGNGVSFVLSRTDRQFAQAKTCFTTIYRMGI